MPTLPTDVRLTYAQKTTTGTLYYECKRCGRKTKTYRKITRHLHRCAKEDLRLGRRKRTSAPR
jgi:ribosomal protein S14